MMKIRQRKYLLAIAALVLVFAGCKGESPTAPTTTTSGGGTGGVTPPTNASLTLTVSNPTPLVDSTTVVTASVTIDNQPAPNGTAVEFKTTLGTFTDANAALTIRTTTGGIATATLTSSSAGTATITATVNNISKTAQATFTLKPTTPTPPDTTPTISSTTPTIGRPAGGEIVTINGKNLVLPIRVIFDYGNGVTKEAQVISSSSTQIQVVTPPVDLGTGQTKDATIVVISGAGSAGEVRITGAKFTYQAEVLTPKVTTLSPTSGPIDGGTRVTIFGEGFQAPVQVFFGAAEAQVLNVTYNQIIVMSPTASNTADVGSGAVTGYVDLKLINVNSATTVTFANAFRYTPKMAITAMGPTQGPFTGGTTVTIDGIGFNDPVAVVVGGVAAMPIKVSGTQIVAVTGAPVITSCGNVVGPTTVTNVDNGDTAPGPQFTFLVPKPAIIGVSTNNTAGGPFTLTVFNAVGTPRIAIGGLSAPISSSVQNSDGSTTFTGVVPTTLQLATQACSLAGAAAPVPTAFDIAYTSLTTACTDTMTKGIVVNPSGTPVLFISPSAFTPFTAAITPATVGPPAVPASVKPSAPQTVSVTNTGSGPLTVTAVSAVGGGCSAFSITNPGLPSTLNACDVFPVIAVYNGRTTASNDICNVNVTTSAGTKSLTLVGTSQ